MEVKSDIKKATNQIKILADSKAAPADSDSNASGNVLCKNKARTGVLLAHKQQFNKNTKNKGS